MGGGGATYSFVQLPPLLNGITTPAACEVGEDELGEGGIVVPTAEIQIPLDSRCSMTSGSRALCS